MNTNVINESETPKSGKANESELKDDTFIGLCKELGRRIGNTENALLCVRAYHAYVKEHPDTAHGQGNKSDRDKSEKSFRHAAAEASGVSPSTIDALLQVGKAIEPLPDDLKQAMASSSLGMRVLRKLAPKRFNNKRENLIRKFIEEDGADPAQAMVNLLSAIESDQATASTKSKRKSSSQAGNKATEHESKQDELGTPTHAGEMLERTYDMAPDEDFETQVGEHRVRLKIRIQPDGRLQVMFGMMREGLTNNTEVRPPPATEVIETQAA